MRLQIEIEGRGFRIDAEFDDPELAYRILEIAKAQEVQLAGLLPPLTNQMPLLAQAPEPAEKKPRKPPVKAEEKPVEAAPVVAAPATPPPALEPVQAAPNGANGKTDTSAFMKVATDACMAAVVRNQAGVRALLKEFGIERFRDLGDDMPRVQAFYDRVVLV
jgi:hypothetical protein